MSVTYDFTGKIVLITGSSSGIGAGIARLFAKSGARVVVCGLDGHDISRVADECKTLSPDGLSPLEVVTNFCNDTDIQKLVDLTIDTYGQLDVLVNNAGIYPRFHINDPDYIQKQRQVFAVNLNPTIYLTHLCAKHLELTKGCIINISSVMGINTGLDLSAYCMSKAAINMFTKCMAVELAPKRIRVNAICPGIVRTQSDLGNDEIETRMRRMAEQCPVGRCGQPSDIANAVAYLASDSSAFITGIIMPVDGGEIAANCKF